jgi:hypothetical protein
MAAGISEDSFFGDGLGGWLRNSAAYVRSTHGRGCRPGRYYDVFLHSRYGCISNIQNIRHAADGWKERGDVKSDDQKEESKETRRVRLSSQTTQDQKVYLSSVTQDTRASQPTMSGKMARMEGMGTRKNRTSSTLCRGAGNY